MNKQKKPLYRYFLIIFIVIILFNSFLLPFLRSQNIEEVNYSTFLTQVEKKKIDEVQIQDNVIHYTVKGEEKKQYETLAMNDASQIGRASCRERV